jgi:Fe-S cluster assembly ATP-binding protein
MPSLIIEKLRVARDDQEILHDVSLMLKPGEVVALMGPNGSGKSTLVGAIMGQPECKILSGRILVDELDVTTLAADKRAKAGLFLSLQNPPEIPGLSLSEFLRVAYNETHEQQVSPRDFRQLLTEKAELLKIDPTLLTRGLNQGFSGGERKKSEILQLLILSPKYALLDETDSGLDVDALKAVGEGINTARSIDANMGILVISHHRQLLEYLKPNRVIIMKAGQITCEGGAELITRIEQEGYK